QRCHALNCLGTRSWRVYRTSIGISGNRSAIAAIAMSIELKANHPSAGRVAGSSRLRCLRRFGVAYADWQRDLERHSPRAMLLASRAMLLGVGARAARTMF